ncbi:Lactaldehyde dehydrogenase [Serratia quinivorans]|nr:Lactaldehyde dehydrogenase [Serratia quinivorans]
MTQNQKRMYINGEFIAHNTGRWIDVINPATEQAIMQIPQGGADEARLAIDAAEAAQPGWEALPAVERGRWLHRLAEGIRYREPELTKLIVTEGGKTPELAKVEVLFTADYLDYMAEWARRYEGEIIQSDRPNENIFLFKKAIGVVVGILPWNFPFFLIARKAAPALVTGNTIVIKPSELTPGNALLFAEIADQIGLPPGMFNLVTGYGPELGQALAANPKVGMVSLTGSVGAGIATLHAAADNVTKVSLELGGKAPIRGLRLLKKQEKAWFFLLFGDQSKINELIFLIFIYRPLLALFRNEVCHQSEVPYRGLNRTPPSWHRHRRSAHSFRPNAPPSSRQQRRGTKNRPENPDPADR